MSDDIIPKEYSIHLSYPDNIYVGRTQILSNCWAYALATIAGYILSIKYDLKPVILSTIWVTSVKKLITKNTGILSGIDYGFYAEVTAQYMLENEIPFKLESCFPEKETLKKLCQEYDIDYVNKDLTFIERHLKLYYLGHEECCIQNRNNYGDCEKLDFSKDEDLRNYEQFNFNVKITRIIPFIVEFSEKNISEIQKNLKQFIWCNKLAISVMICTDEYEEKLYNQDIFIQKESLNNHNIIGYHQIIILGWGKDEKTGLEFWYIKDSNLPFLKKIVFTDSLDTCIGVDILKPSLFTMDEIGQSVERIFSIDVVKD